MPAAQPPRNAGSWIPILGFFLSIAGIIYQGGSLTQQVRQNQERIAKLEAAQSILLDKLNNMDIRGVKNEQKLDFLVEEARDENTGSRNKR